MIGSTLAFLSLFLAIFLPNACQKSQTRTFYAICSGTFTTRARAEERASAMQNAGGGGFIRKSGTFQVLSAVYTDKSDCESVLDGLGEGHAALPLKVRAHGEDLSRIVSALAKIYYGLDGGKKTAEQALSELSAFLAEERFPDRLKEQEGETVREIFDALGELTDSHLSVNLKYFQIALVCAFAEGGKP